MSDAAPMDEQRAAAYQASGMNFPCAEHERDFASGCLMCLDYELDRLRRLIENAPHAEDCWLREDPDEGVLPEYRKCTCWKAGAL